MQRIDTRILDIVLDCNPTARNRELSWCATGPEVSVAFNVCWKPIALATSRLRKDSTAMHKFTEAITSLAWTSGGDEGIFITDEGRAIQINEDTKASVFSEVRASWLRGVLHHNPVTCDVWSPAAH